ncbi:unnamed protein product [Microthlaspi erraticum]|uniref:Aspartic peptidase DDI1-type domain-containing protein n=1 Tax=Microthlaspi erraticum TaxID=1685480 RepID=A0A6D2ITD8_9BRAS|nr:unnamed protein product [Microthlaspi erraticum]CAA7060784.1 unnamed protein product [Microthlaspi erraticum]
MFVPRQQFQVEFPKKQTFGAPPGFQPQPQSIGPAAPEIDVKIMLQQILQGQANGVMDVSKKFAEIHHKLDGTYNDLNSKLEALNSRVQFIESNRAFTSTAKLTGQLPVKSVQNPKEYTHSTSAITLRSGKALPDPQGRSIITEVKNAQGGEELGSDEVSVEDEVSDEHTPLVGELDRVPASETAQPTQAEKPPVSKEKETAFVPPPYKPPMPFPGRFKKQLTKQYKALFDKQMAEIEVKMPLLDAFMLIPPYQKFLKDLILERTKEVQGMVVLSHKCSAIIQRKSIPKKLEDPRSFMLPCSIGPLSFKNNLCDLGVSISLMPLSVAKKLGFTRYKVCQISLALADISVRISHDILEDLPVRIGNVDVPTDFVVLEMDEEPKDPLILGRTFLATAGAVMDMRKGMIDLNLGDDLSMRFDIKDLIRKPTIDGQVFYIEMMDKLADELLEELVVEDHLQTALTKKSEDG